MGLIDKIINGSLEQLAQDAAAEIDAALEEDDPPETESEPRRRIQDTLFNSRDSDGICYRWPGGIPAG
jgi:hypothetical protein